jgi:hypothetical protein
MKNTCSGCDTTWVGLSIAHCGACHETFSTVANFDTHRPRPQEGLLRGRCLDPAGLKRKTGTYGWVPLLKRDSRGFWVGAQPRPEGIAS